MNLDDLLNGKLIETEENRKSVVIVVAIVMTLFLVNSWAVSSYRIYKINQFKLHSAALSSHESEKLKTKLQVSIP